MLNLIDFKKANKTSSGITTCYVPIEEYLGPIGYEGYCHFSGNKITIPHIDLFPYMTNRSSYQEILLSGNTVDVRFPLYGDIIDSLKQYFLENPTREEIQYIVHDNKDLSDLNRFTPFIPGLICSDDGVIIGYAHSYVADFDEELKIEFPHTSSKTYTVSGVYRCEINDNVASILIGEDSTAIISDGENSATVNLYLRRSNNQDFGEARVKIANSYGDYLLASQKVSTIDELSDKLSKLKMINEHYYCEEFISLNNFTFAEAVPDITPNIYKVPIALVPYGNKRVFMTDVTGMSARKIVNTTL